MLANVIFKKNLQVNTLPEKTPLPFTVMKRRNEWANEVVKVLIYAAIDCQFIIFSYSLI